ncbi:hypothetical protein DXG01_007542 [Tephrocybe rancida]|nr:hypothetical protein DXG01_007542 [Tephrocybe rancida]
MPRIEHPRESWVSPTKVSEGPRSCPKLSLKLCMNYSGVASFEQIVNATTHGFNMDYDLASGLTAFGFLSRGNPYINKLSIGLDTPLIPPLPGKIDGPKTRGLGAHGRFEGDVSMTRQDAAIGDNVNFQPELFAELLDIISQVGNDSTVTGPKSIVNEESLSLFKLKRFQESQASNVELQYHIGRLLLSYGETGFTLNFFANGTDGTLSVPTLTSIFRDQRFPANWHRRSSPGTIDIIGVSTTAVFQANPVPPGANAPNGTYITDGASNDCSLYTNLAQDNVPAILVNTTGVLKNNVDFLLNAIHNLFPECPPAVPQGAANV